MTFVAAILLAAGESTRMGRQKALLPWEGTTLLEYQLAQLAAIDEIGEIIVVTGHEPHRITQIASAGERTHVAHNPDYRTGKVSSIKTALAAVSRDADAIMLLAVDQPRPARVHRRVLDAYETGRGPITLPSHDGRHGHPILFDRALLAELAAITEETQGIRDVVQHHASEIRDVECDASVLIDLNSPDDLRDTAPR